MQPIWTSGVIFCCAARTLIGTLHSSGSSMNSLQQIKDTCESRLKLRAHRDRVLFWAATGYMFAIREAGQDTMLQHCSPENSVQVSVSR